MYGVRVVGTNKWIMRIPGHSKVMDDAGSTWTSPPTSLESFYNPGLEAHVKAVEKVPTTTAANMFYRDPSKYLEVIKVGFVEIP